MSAWQHHTIFPDKFLGVLTIQFNEQKLQEGGELLNDEFTLSKRKPRDVVSGRIQIKVMYGTGAKVPKTVKMLPADQKDPSTGPEDPNGRREHRPLRTSSKWGLSRALNHNNAAFVVVEEDSDDENVDSSKPDASPAKKPEEDKPPKKSPRKPKHTGMATMDDDSEEIDWNGDGGKSGKKTGKGGLKTAKRGSGTATAMDDDIDWNGTKGTKGTGATPPRQPKRTAKKTGDGSSSDSDSSSSSEEIDWNGSKGGDGKAAKTTGRPKRTAKATAKNTAASNGPRRTMNLKEQIAEILRLCALEDSIIKNCARDGDNLTFDIPNPQDGSSSSMTLIFPTESVRTGDFLLFTEDGAIEIVAPGSALRAMAKVMENYAEAHHLTEYQPQFPKDVDTTSSDTEEDTKKGKKRNPLLESFHEVDFTGGSSTLGDTSGNVVRHTEEFQKLHGAEALGVIKGEGRVTLRFAISPDTILSDLMADIWQINNTKRIVIELAVVSGSSLPPAVSLYQTSDKNLNANNLETSTFGLMWYLQKRLERYFAKNWPPTASNHLFLDMITYSIDKISVCTKTCVICDTTLAFEMLKPSICDSALCTFSSEQYGLGQDVSAMLQYSPEVFDLLISSTAAIAARAISRSADAERFSPFPSGVEVTDRTSKMKTFMNGSTNNYQLISEVLNKLPSVKDMAQYPNSRVLRSALDAQHPLAFPLLRWILTSNRTHLAKLKPEEHISSIPTAHQYLMLSATPARERVFQQRKAQHGSFWAFHGSGFFNWHAILRCGLRNLSGTALMSTGAVYGNGIYLAAESGTSIGYAQEASGWNLSMHGVPNDQYRCMALCEVVNAGYTANPYYVIPKEEDIVTRYLFIFPPAETSRMQGATIYANKITIPQNSFDQLHAAKKS